MDEDDPLTDWPPWAEMTPEQRLDLVAWLERMMQQEIAMLQDELSASLAERGVPYRIEMECRLIADAAAAGSAGTA